MTFLGHIFSAILLPVLTVAGFLFGGHTAPQIPPAIPIVQEASTSSVITPAQTASISQNKNQLTKTKGTASQSNTVSATPNTNVQTMPPVPTPQPASTPTPSNTISSNNAVSSNTILCNGSYYPVCPTGQQFICANDGIKPYCQVPPPPATAAQIAEIAQLCSYATAQGNAQVIQYCTDGSILNGYNTNAIFRSNIDNISQELQQKIAQQQAAINNQIYVQNWISALNAASAINQSFVNEQNSLNAQNAALQQQQRDAQILQTVQQNQQLLQQQAANTPVRTHCGIDAGVFSCNIPN